MVAKDGTDQNYPMRSCRVGRSLIWRISLRRNPQGTDDLVILLRKVSSQDIATYPEKLKELDGVREVTIVRRPNDASANST